MGLPEREANAAGVANAVATLNERVQVWLNNETRERPAKAVADLHDYFDYQDRQLKQTNINAAELPNGTQASRK